MRGINRHLRQSFLVAIGLVPATASCGPVDADLDGAVSEVDCNDADPDVRPGVAEVCDSVDNNCDGVIDADAIDRATWYIDDDGDGHGDPLRAVQACIQPVGAVDNSSDCLPHDETGFPGAAELNADQIDNDCDGMVDEVACPDAVRAATVNQVVASAGSVPLSFCVQPSKDRVACTPAKSVDTDQLISTALGLLDSKAGSRIGTLNSRWVVHGEPCGPDEDHPDLCCYSVRVSSKPVPAIMDLLGDPFTGTDQPLTLDRADRPVHGRPIVVDGSSRVACTVRSADWMGAVSVSTEGVCSEHRRIAGQHWHEAALHEHASVASFAKFAMDLMALGAPAWLVAAATEAQADEVVHAQHCFAVASTLSGEVKGPGPVSLVGVFDAPVTPKGLLTETILDACINETLAAAEAAYLSSVVQDDSLRALLRRIADDESRHAALGWQTVRWLLGQHPELKTVADAVFDAATPRSAPRSRANPSEDWMFDLGCMPSSHTGALRIQVWADVIAPCARAVIDA